MRTWGGLWTNRAKAHPAKLDRILAAIRSEIQEGKAITNPSGYAHDLWRRFAD
jgi:hypothetical protein